MAEGTKRIMRAEEGRELAMRALGNLGFDAEQSGIIADHLIDAELCGYTFAGLPRILTLAEDPRTAKGRSPISVIHETAISLLLDGGNNVGYYALHRATESAIRKARDAGVAIVGLHNTYMTGRITHYLEKVARADLVGFQMASAPPVVLPLGGVRPALGTNPIALGFPSDRGPVVFDMGTASIMLGELLLHAKLDRELPEGVAIDGRGQPTRVASEALQGGVLPFGAHKGYGLSFAIQALCLLGGAARSSGHVQDFGHLLVIFKPDLLMPAEQFKKQVDELIERVKSTPLRSGHSEILIPSERAFRERARRQTEGFELETAVYEKLQALATRRVPPAAPPGNATPD
jgi:LDH2 family malate/lactate/ureidoglycolate dehydrogenase